MPLNLILRSKLGYALTNREVTQILKEKENEVRVDGKVRRNGKFPVGLMGKTR